MKKLPILAAFFAILFSIQNISAQEIASTTEKKEGITQQDTYQKIELDKVSEIIKAAVEKDFPGASIAEAYIDANKNYKLVLTLNNETKTVYTNARGEWFDPNKQG